MSKTRVFIGASASFIAGVFWASAQGGKILFIVFMLALGVAAVSLGAVYRQSKVVILAICIIFFNLGALRLISSIVPNQFIKLFGTRQDFDGLVVEDPDIRADRQLLTFLPEGFSQKILITAPRDQEYFYGDKLIVSGRVNEPKAFENFDYQKYLERYQIYAVMSYPKILVVRSREGQWLKYNLLKLKQAMVKDLSTKFPEDSGALLMGILIGAKKSLPAGLSEDFQATGLSHIVAVSGYNITILASVLGLLAYVIGRRISLWFSVCAILGFAVIAGWSASVVRASVMGMVVLLGYRSGRPYSAGPSLSLAAAVMVALNPRIAYWDVGFQLSFLATLGIVYGLPLLEKVFRMETGETGDVWAVLLSSVAAILATLPLSLMYFGQIPVYALVANLLVLPVVPYVMLFGFLSLLPFLGPGFAFLAQLILNYIIHAVGWIAHWPGAVLQVNVSPMLAMVCYLFLLSAYFIGRIKLRQVE